MQQSVEVLIPEKVVVTYQLAGLTSRLFACFVDLLVLFGLYMALFLGLPLLGGLGTVFVAFQTVMAAALPFLYFALSESFLHGRTPGKMVSRLRVLMLDGTPITTRAAWARNLLRPADLVPGLPLVGILSILLTPNQQRVGDLLAGTVVVYEAPLRTTFTPAPYKYGIHPLEDRIGSLRAMTSEDYVVLKRMADRLPYLTPEAQTELIQQIWVPFARRLRIQPIPDIHPLYQIEAVVMKYGRIKKLI